MQKQNKGFTFIDLMVALSIFAILVGAAIPSFFELAQKVQSENKVRTIMSMLNYARSEAIVYAQDVVLCPSEKKQQQCAKKWEGPILVFIDKNQDRKISEGEHLLRVFTLITHNTEEFVMWRSFGNKPYIRFDYLGTTVAQNGRFYYCKEKGDKNYNQEVILYRTGRARIVREKERLNRC